MEWQMLSLSTALQLCADMLVLIMEGQTGEIYKFHQCCVASFMLTHRDLFRYLRVPARRLNAMRWWGAVSDHCFRTSIYCRWNLKSVGRDPGFLLSTIQHHTHKWLCCISIMGPALLFITPFQVFRLTGVFWIPLVCTIGSVRQSGRSNLQLLCKLTN